MQQQQCHHHQQGRLVQLHSQGIISKDGMPMPICGQCIKFSLYLHHWGLNKEYWKYFNWSVRMSSDDIMHTHGCYCLYQCFLTYTDLIFYSSLISIFATHIYLHKLQNSDFFARWFSNLITIEKVCQIHFIVVITDLYESLWSLW